MVVVFTGIEIYITIILYGTGVDYCLFLIARYQEERERGTDCGEAIAESVAHVGPALTASAATVIFGIGMMIFARFGKFHDAGIAIAFSLAVSLCVVLTFTTSLLRLAGRWAFWPRALSAADPSAELGNLRAEPAWLAKHLTWFSWDALVNALMRWPALIWLVSVIMLAPLAVGGMLYGDYVDYDFVRRLPPTAPSVAGTKALQQHFPQGAAGIVTVLIYDPELDFLVHDGIGQIEIASLTDQIRKQQTTLQLADIRSWSRPLGIGWAARQASAAPLKEIELGQKQALHYYVSDAGGLKGHVTRLELVMLQDPLSRQGIAALDKIEQTIRAELYGNLRHAQLYFLGTTADMRDMRHVTRSDQIRIEILVIASVLTILIVLLRRSLVCLYLMASVLWSYFAALGATLAVFWWLDPAGFVGLDWKVPVFLFTILVAIGEDYNIFLMTRVAEEQRAHGPIDGIRAALLRTGRVITSCGIIMAATFASLLTASVQDLQHLGFALAFGVLLDTFIVRPILVPTFLLVLERGRIVWHRLSLILEREKDQPARTGPP